VTSRLAVPRNSFPGSCLGTHRLGTTMVILVDAEREAVMAIDVHD